MTDFLTLLAQSHGARPAIIDDRPNGTLVRWTFAELEANANRLGRVFRDWGAKPRDRIIWCGPNSPWVVAAGMAARKIGAVEVPLNYRLTPEEAAYVVDNSDAVLVFTDAEHAALFAQIRARIAQVKHVLVFDGPPLDGQENAQALIEAADPGEITADIDPTDTGTMIYTSGTTGKPKGAVRQGSRDPEGVDNLVKLFGYRADDIYLTTGPLYHSGPSGFMAIAFGLGNTSVLQRKFDAEDWLRLVDKYRVSSTFSAPTPVRLVTQLPEATFARYDVSSIRVVVANAAPWSLALKKAFLAKFPSDCLFEAYGSTELGVNTILRPADQLRKPGSCGQVAPGVEIVLLDDAHNTVTEPHQPGEVFIRSAGVFTTYHKAQDKFEEDRRGDLHTVGDIAFFDEDDYYYICDRKNDMIISGGVNIYPAEIEAALEQIDEVLDVAVFGIPNEKWGETVHAAVVKRPGSDLDFATLESFARKHLAGYKVPRSVEFVAEIPHTGTGKTLKRTLREPYWKDRTFKVL